MGACGADPTFMVDWQDEGGRYLYTSAYYYSFRRMAAYSPRFGGGTFVCYKE